MPTSNEPLGRGRLRLPINKMPRIYQRIAASGHDPAKVFAGMEADELEQLESDWSEWALPYQRLPEGRDWRMWMLLGGRGIGKSLATSQAAHEVAADPDSLGGGIIAIMGRTHTDVRATNINAKLTGILATAPPGFRPSWRPGPGLLEWPNGVQGRVFSADSPQSVLGTNIGFLIADEVARYPKGDEIWGEIIDLAVRVGRAQIAMSTTPLPLRWLRKIHDDPHTIVSHATTYDNPFLATKARRAFERTYRGTRRERQDLFGEFIDSVVGALLRGPEIELGRRHIAPDLVKIVVAVDPAITAHKRSDYTGIVVYGVDERGHGYLLEDASGKYQIANNEWAEVVVDCYRRHRADVVVGEKNRGGDMVEAGIRAARVGVAYESTNATRAKLVRAAPVGALYEQGLIHHVGEFPELELELTTWIEGDPSPNRLDALVWAATYCHLSEDSPQPWDSPAAYMGFQ
jgi:phage terminase large subunit-like protein